MSSEKIALYKGGLDRIEKISTVFLCYNYSVIEAWWIIEQGCISTESNQEAFLLEYQTIYILK